MLVAADVVGLLLAFSLSEGLFGVQHDTTSRVSGPAEIVLFIMTLPGWILVARLYGLYDRDEERADHSTADDLAGVFHLVTVGAWTLYAGAWMTRIAHPALPKVAWFWLFAIVFVCLARALARFLCRRHPAYVQRALIIGANDVGYTIAGKIASHDEYGIELVGFVDRTPQPRPPLIPDVPVLGAPEDLLDIVAGFDVDRAILAFDDEPLNLTVDLMRMLKSADIQIDVVPRLFEVLGPNVQMHSIEGIPLMGLPPARMTRSSRWIKRGIDIVLASIGLVLAAPLFAVIAWRIRRDSPGPVIFRQQRLGLNMREFTLLKFRTMAVDADQTVHRDYIRATMQHCAGPGNTGLNKLAREDVVTGFGTWLRQTSLDELPQLINVLQGEMSLVGPRPCIPYEVELFAPHHFERFLVPPGITGLWQVRARARSTFEEALEMDVAYARGWSLGLDMRLLCRTPLQLFRPRATT